MSVMKQDSFLGVTSLQQIYKVFHWNFKTTLSKKLINKVYVKEREKEIVYELPGSRQTKVTSFATCLTAKKLLESSVDGAVI